MFEPLPQHCLPSAFDQCGSPQLDNAAETFGHADELLSMFAADRTNLRLFEPDRSN